MLYALLFPLLNLTTIDVAPTVETVHTEKVEERKVPNTIACNCVAFARTKRPDIPFIDASMFIPATTTPFTSAIAIMQYPSGAYHVAYVEYAGKGYIDLYHANVSPCKITRERMYLPNKRIIGFF